MTISHSTTHYPILGWMSSEYGKTTIIGKHTNTKGPWEQVKPIQARTLDTKDTWEIFKLRLDNGNLPFSFIHVFSQVMKNTPNANYQQLLNSDLYTVFQSINSPEDNNAIIPGVEVINGKKVFTLFDDKSPTEKTISSEEGEMRFFDFETGEEITPQVLQQLEQQKLLSGVSQYDWFATCRSGSRNYFGNTPVVGEGVATNRHFEWGNINAMHETSLKTPNTDDIFVLQLNGDYNRLDVLTKATNWNENQLNTLKESDLYKAFDAINKGGYGCEGCHIPGKEIINGQEVFTLFDDGQADQKNFTLPNPNPQYPGKMRYFDAQTGKELYTWLPENVNIRDTEKVKTAIRQLKPDELSYDQKTEIVDFYFANISIDELTDDDKKLLESLYSPHNKGYHNTTKELEYCQKIALPNIEKELTQLQEALQTAQAEFEKYRNLQCPENCGDWIGTGFPKKENGEVDHERFDRDTSYLIGNQLTQSYINNLTLLIEICENNKNDINARINELQERSK